MTHAHVPTLTVDLDAVAANVRHLASLTDGAVMAVVKANGFGLGAVDVARTALENGATWLGVATLSEACALRAAGVVAPVLSWLNPVDTLACAPQGVDVAIPSVAHLTAIEAATQADAPRRVHLHLDTGLARDGESPRAWARLCLAARAAEQRGTVRVVGVMGHLPCAAQPLHPSNTLGRHRFAWGLEVARAAGLRPEQRHLAATAATQLDPRSHHTLVRVGAGLVGIDPAGSGLLRGVATLTAPVVTTRRVLAGTALGYGHGSVISHTTTLALLPVGYADCVPREAAGRAEVWLRGQRCPVVGVVDMDQIVVDAGDLPVESGDRAVLFGPGDEGEPSLADWARWSSTLPHAILTGIGSRTRRVVQRAREAVPA